ncbi:U2 small nuclear ribonucleoprotein B' [Panicum miliaceum]|uniref:U2 small nuclear ribonucleoprotein B n=1 Tax=Panicum miliaceum TaxID=4540 RepID=A0A3L6PDT1_PANMI|nr:U2 small nuclear ribonucleoprotein B' [Panicum miliaceum]
MAASYFNHFSYPPAPPPPPGTSPYGAYRHAYPPAPPTAYGAYYDRAEQALPPRDELRTLFIAGLPTDAKPREVYNLFRDFPGYVSSHLRSGKSSQVLPSPYSNPSAYAFAVFANQPSALAALSATNGMVFDLEKNCSLHVDLAKSNSRSKRLRSDDASPYSPEKRTKRPMGFPDSGAGSNIYISGMGNSSHSLSGYSSAQSYTSLESSASFRKDPSTIAPQNNPPCPTLFVANLGPACSEQELIDVFSSCAGFVKLKMQNKLGAPVAFADFKLPIQCPIEYCYRTVCTVINTKLS